MPIFFKLKRKKKKRPNVKSAISVSENVVESSNLVEKTQQKKKLKSFRSVDTKHSVTVSSPNTKAKNAQLKSELDEADRIYLKKTIERFLTKTVPEGAGYKRIKAYVRACVDTDGKCPSLGSDNCLMMILKEMKSDGRVLKDSKKKIWVYLPSSYTLAKLSVKEVAYFKHLGLNDEWYRLGKDPMDAIQWLYDELSWQDFEKFCCVILAHNKVTDVRLSERRKSGADGGVDGHGQYRLEDGAVVNIAIQAKQYRPDRQVQTQEVRDFKGALDEFGLEYGIFVTTCVFSDETIRINKSGVGSKKVQLIDQSDIIQCMLYKAASPHGYGLHKTDIGMYYLNPNMLRQAMDEYFK